MKSYIHPKTILTLIVVCFGIRSVPIAQSRILNFDKGKPAVFQQTKPGLITKEQFPQNQVPFAPTQRTNGTNSIVLGSSANVFTILRTEQNQVYANDSLGLVTFIHRNDNGIFGGSSGNLRYDYSTDKGATWTNNIGVVNPLNTRPARYPNISVYNPGGNTNPDSARIVYSAPTLNPSPDWDGHVNGLWKVGVSSGGTENYNLLNQQTYFPGGLCQGLPGEFWTVDSRYDGITTGGEIFINKGIYNPNTQDIIWVRQDTLNPPHSLSFDGSPNVLGPNIAFSPDGMTGWIAWIGDLQGGVDTTLAPCLIKSTDGGATWGGYHEFDYNSTPWVYDTLRSLWTDSLNNPLSSGEGTAAFDFDLVVDANGNPHLAHVVGSRTLTIPGFTVPNYSFHAGVAKFMADVSSTDGGSTWHLTYLSPVLTFRTPDYGTTTTVNMDNNPQVARSQDGNVIFYSWVDSDTAQFTGSMNGIGFGESSNLAPNLRISGRNIVNNSQTYPILVTDGDLTWEGRALFPTMAPEVLFDGTDYMLPIVISEFADPISQTFFHYFGDEAKINPGQFCDPDSLDLCWDVIGGGTLPPCNIPGPRPLETIGVAFTPLEWQPKLDNVAYDLNGNYLEDTLETMSGQVNVMLALNRCIDAGDSAYFAGLGDVNYIGKFLTVLSLENVDTSSLSILANDSRVAMVYSDDDRVHVHTDVSRKAMKVQTSTVYAPNTLEDAYPGTDGTGVTIAIIDTGMDNGPGGHSMLPGNRYVGGFNAITRMDIDPDDDHGHGTHVGGIALGSTVPGGYGGVAQGANYVDIKVLGANGFGTFSDVFAGIEKCIERRNDWNLKVINLSLGAGGFWDGTNPGAVLLGRVAYYGILPVVSMGNSAAFGAGHMSNFAASDDALSVASVNDFGTIDRTDDMIGPLSSRGPRIDNALKPDVACYGGDISSAQHNTSNGIITFFGTFTSMAAPHVAGLAALICQANPTMPVLSIKELIIRTAEDRGANGWDGEWGHGLVDAHAAFVEMTTCTKTDLKFDVFCYQPGNSTWWDSPQLYPGDANIVVGVPNSVNAVVRNDGPAAANGIKVKIGIYEFGADDPYYPIATVSIATLAAGATTTVTVPWTPQVSSASGSAHACLKAEIIYPCDLDYDNNCAQHNVDIKPANTPATFTFQAVNSKNQDLEFWLDIPPTLPNGWTTTLSDSLFTLSPGDCPKQITVDLDPVAVPFGDSIKVPVHVLARRIGMATDTIDMGGVTLCAVNMNPNSLTDPYARLFDFQISPNPFSDRFKVEFTLPAPQNTSLRVWNLTGQLVFEQDLGECKTGRNTREINVNALPQGIYTVELLTNERSTTRKLVKH